jgi:hypothetical protein
MTSGACTVKLSTAVIIPIDRQSFPVKSNVLGMTWAEPKWESFTLRVDS